MFFWTVWCFLFFPIVSHFCWMKSTALQETFSSDLLYLETKLADGLAMTDGWKQPNRLSTVVACACFDIVIRRLSSHQSVLNTIRSVLYQSIFQNYTKVRVMVKRYLITWYPFTGFCCWYPYKCYPSNWWAILTHKIDAQILLLDTQKKQEFFFAWCPIELFGDPLTIKPKRDNPPLSR